MIFEKYTNDEIRSFSRMSLETLEYWLKQVIHETMSTNFGNNYLDATDEGGSPILKKDVIKSNKKRYFTEKDRFKRFIDAAFLDDIIYIICHRLLYNSFFKNYFEYSYPNGVNELRNILNKLIEPRNRLSHSNPISHRQAEQIICYSHDIIDSVKNYYLQKNLHMEFNVPRVVRFKDSFGNEEYFDKSTRDVRVNLAKKKDSFLRPGDMLEIELDIDESFSDEDYTLVWRSVKTIPNFGNTKKISLKIEDHHIGENFCLQCYVSSKKSWHRIDNHDDLFLVWYTVLPNE